MGRTTNYTTITITRKEFSIHSERKGSVPGKSKGCTLKSRSITRITSNRGSANQSIIITMASQAHWHYLVLPAFR
jgi:hypothetical protein